jgi:hypothetical protein
MSNDESDAACSLFAAVAFSYHRVPISHPQPSMHPPMALYAIISISYRPLSTVALSSRAAHSSRRHSVLDLQGHTEKVGCVWMVGR